MFKKYYSWAVYCEGPPTKAYLGGIWPWPSFGQNIFEIVKKIGKLGLSPLCMSTMVASKNLAPLFEIRNTPLPTKLHLGRGVKK
jgi:hypothetical protein